MLTSESK